MFATAPVTSTISAFGPGLISLAHAPDEYVEVEDLVRAAEIFALTAVGYINRMRTASHTG